MVARIAAEASLKRKGFSGFNGAWTKEGKNRGIKKVPSHLLSCLFRAATAACLCRTLLVNHKNAQYFCGEFLSISKRDSFKTEKGEGTRRGNGRADERKHSSALKTRETKKAERRGHNGHNTPRVIRETKMEKPFFSTAIFSGSPVLQLEFFSVFFMFEKDYE